MGFGLGVDLQRVLYCFGLRRGQKNRTQNNHRMLIFRGPAIRLERVGLFFAKVVPSDTAVRYWD
jgi:hypothetical protein